MVRKGRQGRAEIILGFMKYVLVAAILEAPMHHHSCFDIRNRNPLDRETLNPDPKARKP